MHKGIPVKVNGKTYNPVDLIIRLNEIGGRNGVGRVDMVENRLVGIKSREIYENPAGTILMTAHKELEAMVLDRETLHYKELISPRYAELTYYGLWETPLRHQLDAFINKSQERVSGIVRLKLLERKLLRSRDANPNSPATARRTGDLRRQRHLRSKTVRKASSNESGACLTSNNHPSFL